MNITFIWPAFSWGFLLLPLLVVLYVRLLRKHTPYAVSFSTAATLRVALAKGGRFRRHLPALLMLAALISLLTALTRPVVPLPVPADRSAIMLAIDVSGSMRSEDIRPNRLEAAKTAAKAFVSALPDRVRVGVVAFAGYAALLAPPVTDHQRVIELIDGAGTARRTAIGEGLIEAVAALPGRSRPAADGTLPTAPQGPKPPGIVVLLSDGRSNTGMDPLLAVEVARRQQVTVYTVGVGQRVTPDNAWTIGGPLDEETLQAIAALTGGVYYHAASAEGLREIYRKLARSMGWERQPVEVSAVAAGFSAVTLLAALATSWLLVHPLGI